MLQPSPIQPAPIAAMGPTAMSVRYSYACDSCYQSIPARKAYHSALWQSSKTREGLWEREKRIFGGSGDEGDGEDLKAPMLDVVLGLFDGLDYDDDACC